MFTQLTADEVQNATVVNEIGGDNKIMEVCEAEECKFARIKTEELQFVNTLDTQTKSPVKANKDASHALYKNEDVERRMEVREVGEYVIFEFIEGECLYWSDVDVSDKRVADTIGAMLCAGIPDATKRNIMIDENGLLVPVDYDWADKSAQGALDYWLNNYSEFYDDKLVQMVKDRVSE